MSQSRLWAYTYALWLSLAVCVVTPGRAEEVGADGGDGGGDSTAAIVVVILLIVLGVYSVWLGIIVVKEKETVVIERFGRFHSLLTPGFHCIIPYIDARKYYKWRYFESKGGNEVCITKKSLYHFYTTGSYGFSVPASHLA